MKFVDFINTTEHRQEYDEIVSLGFNCAVAFALKDLYLRNKSYPLDWGRVVEEKDEIGFRRKVEFLCTNFKDFINEQDLYIFSDNKNEENKKHMAVHNSFNGMHFFHDFPKGKTIADVYPDVKEKYERRIERLMDLINSDKKICFVFYAGLAKLPMAEIIYSTEIFYKIFPKRNVDFLILQNDPDIGDEVVYENLSDNVRRILFYNGPNDKTVQLEMSKIVPNIRRILNALVKAGDKKTDFSTNELNSNNRVDDIITNPKPDFKGMISFGPYAPVDSGAHSVVVKYDLTANYRAFFDVACDLGKIVVPKTELPHDTNSFKFDFNLNKNVSDLEVRFYCEPTEIIDENNRFKLFGIHID